MTEGDIAEYLPLINRKNLDWFKFEADVKIDIKQISSVAERNFSVKIRKHSGEKVKILPTCIFSTKY